jgi:hypothetical protein
VTGRWPPSIDHADVPKAPRHPPYEKVEEDVPILRAIPPTLLASGTGIGRNEGGSSVSMVSENVTMASGPGMIARFGP